jgi:ribosomal protein L3 glutamine methyltransferase
METVMVREKPAHSIAAGKTVRDAIVWARDRLAAARLHFGHGTDNPLDEAAWLVSGALRLPPAALARRHGHALSADVRARLQTLVAQRVRTRRPAAYLLNEAWFAGLRFYVDERVIVPRSLTGEFIRERFAPWIDPARVRRILDLGTGSACMAIACARAFPAARVDATDVSSNALAVARINVDYYGLRERVRLVRSDLFSALTGRRYDVIVTNPPYVGRAEMKSLPKEYRLEPRLALESGETGLDVISRILRDAADYLEPSGILVAEVGNSNVALQKKFPRLPFLWLATESGDDAVFLLTAKQLREYRRRGRTSASSRSRRRPRTKR